MKKDKNDKCILTHYGEKCKNKAQICKTHYDDVQRENGELYRKNKNKNIIIVSLILFFLGIISLIISYNTMPSPDVNTLCLDKLNHYFPEYQFEKAEYSSMDKQICRGHYQIESPIMIRDGLKEVVSSEKLTKEFELTDEYDKENFRIINNKEGTSLICLFVGAILLFIAIMNITSLNPRRRY